MLHAVLIQTALTLLLTSNIVEYVHFQPLEPGAKELAI